VELILGSVVRLLAAAVAAHVLSASPALAQVPPVAAGAVVVDMSGAAVGTVIESDASTVLVRTDKHEARLPLASMAPYASGGFVIAMSQAQLNAAVEYALATAQPSTDTGPVATGAGSAAPPAPEAESQGEPAASDSPVAEPL
jgi:hypothetical protein